MFESCVIKLTSVCNLDCSYCYMFNLNDKTYQKVPNFMASETALLILEKVRSYLEKTGRKTFSIVLHGGEPTLWSFENFEQFFSALERHRKDGYAIEVSIQTNAYKKLEQDFLALLDRHQVNLGISLDGPAAYHDKFRVTRSGAGSYAAIMNNVSSIIQSGYEHLIGGFLTVVQPEIEVEEFLSWVEALPIKKIDVLWPIEFNYDNPPWQSTEQSAYANNPRYGKWFADLFKLWWQKDDPEIYIRLFYNILQYKLGDRRHIDVLVNDTLNMFVVNTDGRIEYPDYLRAVADEASKSPFNILDSDITEFAQDLIFATLLNLGQNLPKECYSCPHRQICGGGFLPGRASQSERISSQKSVLCLDQFYFFSKINEVMYL